MATINQRLDEVITDLLKDRLNGCGVWLEVVDGKAVVELEDDYFPPRISKQWPLDDLIRIPVCFSKDMASDGYSETDEPFAKMRILAKALVDAGNSINEALDGKREKGTGEQGSSNGELPL